MRGGIYAFLNLINEKIYVGSAKDFYKRYHVHKSMLTNNKHDNSYFQRAWNKYGSINFMFVILEYVNDFSKLEEREQYWIDTTNCYDNKIGYNARRIANSNLGLIIHKKLKLKLAKLKWALKLAMLLKSKCLIHHLLEIKKNGLVLLKLNANVNNVKKHIGLETESILESGELIIKNVIINI